MPALSRTAVIAVLATAASLGIAHGQSLQTDEARKLLTTLCETHAAEPACVGQADLAEEDAWVILRTACRTDDSKPCQTFRQTQGASLVLNAREKSWAAFWEDQRLELKFDVAGVPTLRLKPREARPLKVLVTDISPLTYTAKPGTPKEDDLAVVAGLKSLLSLAGTGVQALIQSVTYVAPAGVPTSPDVRVARPGELEPFAVAPVEECVIPSPDVAPVASLVSQRNTTLVEVHRRLRDLEQELGALEAAKSAFVRTMQRAEDRDPVTVKDLVPPKSEALDGAYHQLERISETLASRTDHLTSCQPLLSAYLAVLGSPNDAAVLRALVAQVQGTEAACAVDSLRSAIMKNAGFLAPACAPTAPQLEAALKFHNSVMKPQVERLLNARQVEATVWQALDKARSGKYQVLTGAATLVRQVQIGSRHTWQGTLIRELAVTRQNPDLPWNKVQSHSVVIKVDSPYVKEVSLANGAEETHNYRLESATGRILGYGVGVIYTPLFESTWTAATVPGTSTKVIAETKRASRSGDLAAFLTYRFMEHRPRNRAVQPIVEFGVGVTSDRPAFFLGTGLEFLRAGRVGIGWAPQRVTRLVDTQRVNETVVTGNDDIRTEKRFDTGNWYMSFSFALDSLSLFNRP